MFCCTLHCVVFVNVFVLYFFFYSVVFRSFCQAAKEALLQPINTSPQILPRIHQLGDGHLSEIIKTLSKPCAIDIISNHENSAKSWEKQIVKVTLLFLKFYVCVYYVVKGHSKFV